MFSKEEEYTCIEKLKNTEYYEKWFVIQSIYKPELDAGAYSSNIKYTTHNYTTHCRNIYRNLDFILNFETIKNHELFLLDIAVILHDIMMTYKPKTRADHPKAAREYIIDQINSQNLNVLNSKLDYSEAEAIGDIILGHGGDTLGYLVEHYLSNVDTIEYKKNRICHLAAALRFADELDITADRIERVWNNMFFEDSYEDIESQKHHRRLSLISRVGVNPAQQNQICLFLNDSFYKNSDNKENDIEDVFKIVKKIEKEITAIEGVYNRYPQELCCVKRYQSVKVKSDDTQLNTMIEEALKSNQAERKKKHIINEEINLYYNKAVIELDCIVSGHYRINEKVCTRDWIDTAKLINNNLVLKDTLQFFYDYIIGLPIDRNNVFMVCVGGVAEKIGSILAFQLNIPFTYAIPKHLHTFYDGHDTSIVKIPENKKIIILTDVIITGITISEIVKDYNIQHDDILKIMSIFCRNFIFNGNCNKFEEIEQYRSKLYVLNGEFEAEIILKDNCQLFSKFKKCTCKNQVIN